MTDPGFSRRPLLRARRGADARPAHRAHDRPHHLSVRRRDDGEVRPRATAARRAGLRFRHRLRDRVLPALPGRQVRRRTSTPTPTCASPRRSTTSIRRRTTAATWRPRSRAPRPPFSSSRSHPTGASRPRARARSCARCSTTGASSPTSKSTRRGGHDCVPAGRRALPRRAARLLRQHRALNDERQRPDAARAAPTSPRSQLGGAGRARARPRLRRRRAAAATSGRSARRRATASKSTTPRCSPACRTTSTCCRWTWRTACPLSPTARSTT